MEIPGFSNYTIDLDGNIWNKKRKLFMKTQIDLNGYEKLQLINNDKKAKYCSVGRLVGLTFIPNPDDKPQIDHLDRNPLNNNYLNLEWKTGLENMANRSKMKSNSSGYMNIAITRGKRGPYYDLQIKRLGKLLFRRLFTMNKYTLEEVVKIRNEKYKEFNIEIRD